MPVTDTLHGMRPLISLSLAVVLSGLTFPLQAPATNVSVAKFLLSHGRSIGRMNVSSHLIGLIAHRMIHMQLV